jgi:hypothetical protein
MVYGSLLLKQRKQNTFTTQTFECTCHEARAESPRRAVSAKKPLRGNLMYARYVTGITMLALATLTTSALAYQVPGARTGIPVGHQLPPAQMLMEPGVGGPGPGVLNRSMPSGPVQNASYESVEVVTTPTIQVLFDQPKMMKISWDVSAVGMYDSTPLVVPGRQNFAQGGIFRLKVTEIEGRPGMELYPTLEVGRANTRTAAYLSHAAVPVQLTQEDFDQVAAANFVTKVIYVPDPEFQELALAGVDTIVSTRLDPGVDPITEADRRGSILAIVRMGNKDLEVPGSDPAVAAGGSGMMGGGVSNYISGVTGPNYGMPMTGTNIGLPGPPHIPLGVSDAGLQAQVGQRSGLNFPSRMNTQLGTGMIRGVLPPDSSSGQLGNRFRR